MIKFEIFYNDGRWILEHENEKHVFKCLDSLQNYMCEILRFNFL